MVDFNKFDFKEYYFAITRCFDSCISYNESYNESYNHDVFDDNIYFDSLERHESYHDDWFIKSSGDGNSISLVK